MGATAAQIKIWNRVAGMNDNQVANAVEKIRLRNLVSGGPPRFRIAIYNEVASMGDCARRTFLENHMGA